MPPLVRAFLVAWLLGSTLVGVAPQSSAGVQAPGDRLWVSRFQGPGNEVDPAIATSPLGSLVFVAGTTAGSPIGYIVAYEPATGAEVWVSEFRGDPTAITVSPDGSRVYATGGGRGYKTEAYDAATGGLLWAASYRVGYGDLASSLALSQDGLRLFVTGTVYSPSTGDDYATIGYDTMTGERLWVSRYNGPPTTGHDDAAAIDISPSGEIVFVTGSSHGSAGNDDWDIATIAYEASTGSQRWLQRFVGTGHQLADLAYSLTASEDGRRVFVAGQTSSPDRAAVTLAYRATTGTWLWARRYDGPVVGGEDIAFAVVEHAGTVYITGVSEDEQFDTNDLTISYDSAGTMLWLALYAGAEGSSNAAVDIGVGSDGTSIFITGYTVLSSQDYLTVAYDATNGDQRWANTYDPATSDADGATSLAVSPDGAAVFVTGQAGGLDLDLATIAYSA
jgi:hypothetical protein